MPPGETWQPIQLARAKNTLSGIENNTVFGESHQQSADVSSVLFCQGRGTQGHLGDKQEQNQVHEPPDQYRAGMFAPHLQVNAHPGK